MTTARLLLLLALLPAIGCGTTAPGDRGVIIFVPGVNGDGPWYGNFRAGLRDGGVDLPVQSHGWGAPTPLFVLNFNTKSIHESAERKLAERIVNQRRKYPSAPVMLLTHSAGGGVALGALAKLPAGVSVDRLILLHPTVSPGFDLRPALERVRESAVVFHSSRDTTFLQWRTGTFGTYDGVKTAAAGNTGFDAANLDPATAAKLRQIPYDDAFRSLGHDGGHFDVIARPFVREKVAPLLRP